MTIYINGKFLSQRLTGVQRYAFEITKVLIDQGAPVLVLVPPIVDISSVKDLPKNALLSIGSYKNIHAWEQLEINKFLKRKDRYVLLSLCNMAPLSVANQVICLHDIAFLKQPKWFSWQFRMFYKIAIPRLLKRAKKLITVSEFSKAEICEHLNYPKENVEVVYNAPSKQFSAAKYDDFIWRKDDFFLFVGSHDPRKNLSLLLKLFSLKEFADQKLVVVGGKSKSFKQEELHNTPNVIIKENCDDTQLANYYRTARALINPSFYEGFGLPIIEAMASGCPIILSDIAVFREVAGKGALYFSPDSLESLRRIMTSFMENEEQIRQAQILHNFQRNKDFSWHRSGEKLLKILQQM